MPTSLALPPAEAHPEQQLLEAGRLIKMVFSSLLRHVDARMQPLELTAMQWEPLVLLSVGRADTVAGLARECRMDCGAMTRMLDRLEQKQLLQRQRSDSDRRVVHLALTAKGSDVAAGIPQIVRDELQQHVEDFSGQELQQLIQLLNRMLCNKAGSAPGHEASR